MHKCYHFDSTYIRVDNNMIWLINLTECNLFIFKINERCKTVGRSWSFRDKGSKGWNLISHSILPNKSCVWPRIIISNESKNLTLTSTLGAHRWAGNRSINIRWSLQLGRVGFRYPKHIGCLSALLKRWLAACIYRSTWVLVFEAGASSFVV